MKKLILAIFLLFLFPVLAFAATTNNKPVTQLVWNNPSTNTDVTSILITCGSLTYSATASTAITAGSQGSVPLSSVLTATGTYTCSAAAVNANGTGASDTDPVPITATSSGFTIAVTVPDALTGLTAQ